MTSREPHFDGPSYDPELDFDRLTTQLHRIKDLMLSGDWLTLGEISETTGDPESSISAQLRHLRKVRFGSYVVRKRKRGDRTAGLYEYRLLAPGSEDDGEGEIVGGRRMQITRDEAEALLDGYRWMMRALFVRKVSIPVEISATKDWLESKL